MMDSSNRQEAIDVKGCTREQAQALGLDDAREFHPYHRPRAKLLPIIQQFHGWLVGEDEVAPAPRSDTPPPIGDHLIPEAPARARGRPVGTVQNLPAELDCLGRLVAELITSEGHWLSYSRKKEWYAKRREFALIPTSFTCNRVVRLVDKLRAAGLVDHVLGYKKDSGQGFQSMLRPSAAFWEALGLVGYVNKAEALKLTEADPGAPAVVVKDEHGQIAPPRHHGFEAACRDVASLRSFMRSFVIEAPVQPGRKELVQVFNSSHLDKGGRYYGWWQNLTKTDRLRIKLDGSSVVELDYGVMHPSLLYHDLGLLVPEQPYHVEGEERDLCKATFGRMLNSKDQKGTLSKMAKELGNEERAERLVSALLALHKPLADAGEFWSGVGHELMRKDAKVAEQVMFWAMWAGVPMLPVHDSFIVRREDAEACEQSMLAAYHALMGIRPTVKRSEPAEPLPANDGSFWDDCGFSFS